MVNGRAAAAVRSALGDIAITPRIECGIAGRGIADRWNFDTILLTSYLMYFPDIPCGPYLGQRR